MDAVGYDYLSEERIFLMLYCSSVRNLLAYTLIILQLMKGCAIKTDFSNVN